MSSTASKAHRRADNSTLDLIFREARTFYAWEPTPVPTELLKEVYELAKFGPTSLNGSPLRLLFLTTSEAKERLIPALMDTNKEKSRTAPVVVLFAFDTQFFEHLPRLMPGYEVVHFFANSPEKAEANARQNSTLQAAYFMLAARSLGLDCGPMGGFDAEKVNAEFFPEGRYKINFVCNLGYGVTDPNRPRNPRLEFEEVAQVL